MDINVKKLGVFSLVLVLTFILCSCAVTTQNLIEFQDELLNGTLYYAEKKYSTLSEAEKEQADDILKDLVQNIKLNYESGKISYHEAIDAYIIYDQFFYDQVGDIIVQDREYVEDCYNLKTAQTYFSQGKYIDALGALMQINPSSEFASEAESYYKSYCDSYVEHVKSRCELLSDDLESVLKIISEAKSEGKGFLSNWDSLNALESKYVTEFINTTLAKAQNANDFEKSIEILNGANKMYSCTEFKDAISNYKYKLEQQKEQEKENTINAALAKASSLANQKRWGEAVAALEALDKGLQTDEVKEKIKFYKKYYSKSFEELEIYSSFAYEKDWNPVDKFGNEYKRAIRFMKTIGAKQDPYVEYRINGYYNTLRFSIAPLDLNLTEGTVKIYCDNKLVKEYKNIQNLTSAITDKINIDGAVFLKIEVYQKGSKILIGNFSVSNE